MPLDRQQREAWFSETVDPLPSEMEAKVVDTPDDPRAWVADYVDMDRDSGAIIGSTSKAGWGRAARTASADSVGRLLAAADATAAKKEEADTEAPEDVRDLNALLLPSGTLPLDVECFSVSYSSALFAGWVKQGSPCCAAASVAGAWNALSGRSRGVEGALSSELVLGAMRAVLEDRIAAMTSRFERLLGGSVAPLLLAITTELSREGKHLGGRGARAAIAKAPHLLRLTRSITSRELEKEGHSPTFDLLWELYEDEKKEAEASGATGEGLGTAMAAGRDRAVKQEAWTASVASEGAEDGISSVEDDVAAKHGGREESVGINTEDESGVGGANDAVSVVALAGEERRHPRQSPSGRPKGIDPADKCGQRVALRPRVGHRREEGGGTIRTCRGGRGGQPRSRERTQGSREEREERYVGEKEVGEGEEEDEGEKVMCSETKGGVSGGVCGLKGASEQRRGRKPRKAKKGGEGEEQGRSTGWKWKKDLCSLLKLMGGLDKLCSKSPSTAAFGNAGLMSTVRYLDGDLPHDGEVTARLFMGKGRARSVRLQVPLSAQDGEEEKAKQWAALREAFLTDRQVLLFHLTNHFALIFALREWRSSTGPTTTTATAAAATTTSTATAAATVATNTATTTASATAAATATAAINNQQSEAAGLTTTLPSDSPDHPSGSRYPAMPTTDDPGHSQGAAGGGREPVAGKGDRGVRQDRRGVPGGGWSRQMLTARRGQRPTAWVDFEEARRIMLGWEGYKIMTVRRGGAAAAAAVTLGGR